MVSTSNNFWYSSVNKYFKTKCWRPDQQRWSQDRGSLNLWTHQWNAWHPSCEIEFDCHLWIFKIAIRPIEMFRRNTECLHQCGLEYAQDKIFNIHTWDSMCLHCGFVTKWLKWNHLKFALQNIQLEQIYSMVHFEHNVKRNLLTNFILSIDLLSASDSWYFIHDATATIISYLRFCYHLRQISTV